MFNDLLHDILLLCGKRPKEISLLAWGIHWCSNVSWVQRLEAYKQLELWVSVKHQPQENHDETTES
mgnify:CR=1 FL=1